MLPQSSRLQSRRETATPMAPTRHANMALLPLPTITWLLLACCCYYCYENDSCCHAFTTTTGMSTPSTRIKRRSRYLLSTTLYHQPTPIVHRRIAMLRQTMLSNNNNNNDNSNNSNMNDVYVMVNGMPGPMATAAAEACLRKGLQLSPIAMTGPNLASSTTITVVDPVTQRHANVRLISSTDRDEMTSSLAGIRAALGRQSIYAIDYTHPSAVHENCQFYIQQNLPFVMGTTGGNRTALYHAVVHDPHHDDTNDIHVNFSCVMAPNMGKQIVAMQAALSDLATNYPGAFAGYQLQVTESHQKTKADTSGTAKAVIDSIKLLTSDTDFTYDDIQMIRDNEESIQFGVPERVIAKNTGHAYHTYTLTSPDQTVQFQLQHNVVGRTVYAEGTADAVKFLVQRMRQPNVHVDNNHQIPQQARRVYDMIDVLKEGALE